MYSDGMQTDYDSSDYERVTAAIRFLEMNVHQQPTLDDLAAHLHLSPFHLQRIFTRWAGISPKRFLQYLTVEHAKARLAQSHTLLDASLEIGLSGPGRLHDLFVNVEAVTPGDYRRGGLGVQIAYGVHRSPFGDCLLAVTERGVCSLSFLDDDVDAALTDLHRRWPLAQIRADASATTATFQRIFAAGSQPNQPPIPLLLKGTNFQLRVWEALLRIPPGAVCTYEDVAQLIGHPTAARAVGAAVGANAVAYLIPCHRVIRKSGLIQDYRWGPTRKKAMLGWEAAHNEVAYVGENSAQAI